MPDVRPKVMKYRKQIFSFALILFFTGLFFLALIGYTGRHSSGGKLAANGTLDFSGQKQHFTDRIFSINGDWEFYWQRLVTERDVQAGARPDLIPTVPKVWNSYRIGGKTLPGYGFATYRLRVTGVEPGKPLALWIPTFSTAYRLYIDDRLLASNGVVSQNEQEGKPEYRPNIVSFTPSGSDFSVLVQVSNYTYSRGGMWGTLYLGQPDRMAAVEKVLFCRDMFLLGSFFVMAFIYSSVFYFRRKEKCDLFFAALCLAAAVRTILHGSYLIRFLFPFLGFSAMIRMDYLTLYWFPAMLTLLLRELFPEEIPKILVYVIGGYTAFMTVLTLATPVSFFTTLINPIEILILVLSGYLLPRMCLAVARNRLHAALTLTGCLVVLGCCTCDFMTQNNMLPGSLFEFTPFGFFILLMTQAHILAESFADTIQKKEKAFEELEASQERERKSELKFLKSQIRPHFIYNALNTILSVSRRDVARSQQLLMEFSTYLRGCFDFKDLEDTIPVEKELVFVRSYLALEQARFGGRLKVQYEIDDTHFRVPPLTLQPLVENAVVHGIRPKPDGGSILVYVRRAGDTVRVGVEDDGVGIDPERIKNLSSGEETSRSVGIYNITRRLQKMYHVSLCIRNRESGGADVYMELPWNGGLSNDKSHAD